MPDGIKKFGGSLVLDFRKRWRHVNTMYMWTSMFMRTSMELFQAANGKRQIGVDCG